jgi:hypothetical protein
VFDHLTIPLDGLEARALHGSRQNAAADVAVIVRLAGASDEHKIVLPAGARLGCPGKARGSPQKGQLTVLSAVFKYAGRHLGYTGTNPVTLLDRVERPGTEDDGAEL